MRALLARTGHTTPLLQDVEEIPLGPHDVGIAVTAAAVNPADIWVVGGQPREIFGLPESVGLGYDLSGIVMAVGSAVRGFHVGDAVAALHTDLAAPVRGQAEVATVPVSAVAQVPEGLDLAAAATVPLNALTAAQALDLLGAPDGQSLLITGAGGAVGGYAITLAARTGWRVAALARTADEEFVLRAGADQLLTEIPGPHFDAVLDAAAMQDAALTAARDRGRLVGVIPPMPITPERGIEVSAVNVRGDATQLASLLRLTADGELEIREAGRLPLSEAETAYAKVAAGGQRGRWLLLP